MQFMGEYNHSIDAKGRVIVPSRFREQLGDRFIVTKGLDGCLWVFPNSEWEEFSGKLASLPVARKETRNITRFFLAGATEAQVDKMGRILIPQVLRDYAKLDAEAVLTGNGSKVEIWNKESWEQISNFDDVDELAEQMGELGFDL